MSKYLKIAVLGSLISLSPFAVAAPYSLTNMPSPTAMAASVTPGQDSDNIQPDGMQNMAHLFRTGEGWSNGSQAQLQLNSGCDWDLGTGCSFNAARDCEIAGSINTCNFEVMVNGTYLTVNRNTGQTSCDSDSAGNQVYQSDNSSGDTVYQNSCPQNVEQVTINWGDGTTGTATYDTNPSSNPDDPQDVPMYIASHSYSSLPNGAPGTYKISVTENVDGTWSNVTTYTYQDVVNWDLNYGYYGNGSCTYGWSGTNQMTVATSAGSMNSAYLESIDFNPSSGFSGATNITGSTEVCNSCCGNSGIGGSGFNLIPLDYPFGSAQQVAYGNNLTLSPTSATWSGGPITIGNAWGWFEFYVANSNTVDITYNGAQIGTISSYSQAIPHVTQVLNGGQEYTQFLQVYVYKNTPPPIQGGAENAGPTPSTLAEEPNP